MFAWRKCRPLLWPRADYNWLQCLPVTLATLSPGESTCHIRGLRPKGISSVLDSWPSPSCAPLPALLPSQALLPFMNPSLHLFHFLAPRPTTCTPPKCWALLKDAWAPLPLLSGVSQPGIPLETEPGKPPVLRKPWPLPWRPSCQAQACGRCVCRCLALEIYNLWQEGGAAFGSISSVLKQRTVASASRGADECRRSNRPCSHFSPWLPATPFLPAASLVGTCLPLPGPTFLLAPSPCGRYVTYSFYLPSLSRSHPVYC